MGAQALHFFEHQAWITFLSGKFSLKELTPTSVFWASLHNQPFGFLSCFDLFNCHSCQKTMKLSQTENHEDSFSRTVNHKIHSTLSSVQGRTNTVQMICNRQIRKGHQLWRGIHYLKTNMTSDTMLSSWFDFSNLFTSQLSELDYVL